VTELLPKPFNIDSMNVLELNWHGLELPSLFLD
jgi:hypothetical protein